MAREYPVWMRPLRVMLMVLLVWAAPLRADPADLTGLINALRLPDVLGVMRAEGLAQGEDLGADLLPDRNDARWLTDLDRLYDEDRMLSVVTAELRRGLAGVNLAPLTAYFLSDIGQQLIAGELSARRAFLDPAIEDAARSALLPPESEDGRGLTILAFIAANDMVDLNLSGGMNDSLRFYQGLAQGGQLDMSEADMLDDVWSREEETRTDSALWLRALLTRAYRDIPVDGIAGYVELSLTPEGKALNVALFAGFDRMYGDLNYALGLALASRLSGEDL